MLNAQELDASKFPPTIVDVHGFRELRRIQEEVKTDVEWFERLETEMLFKITDKFLLKDDAEQKCADERFLNDREKFKIILHTVSDQCGISIERLKEHRRFREIVIPRSIAIFLTRFVTELSTDDIARGAVNGEKLNHSTIIYSCTKITEAIKFKDEKIYPMLQKIISALRDEGIQINLKSELPKWYSDLLVRDENKTLVTG